MKTQKVSDSKLRKVITNLVKQGKLPSPKRILREHHVVYWDRWPTSQIRKMLRPGFNGSTFGPKRNRDAAIKSLMKRARLPYIPA